MLYQGDSNNFWVDTKPEHDGREVTLVIFFAEPNGAFQVMNGSSETMMAYVSEFEFVLGDSEYQGAVAYVGREGNPNPFANVYASVHRLWDQLQTSPIYRTHIRYLKIYLNQGETTVASYINGRIDVGASHWYTGGVMHEMGHIAEYVAASSSPDGAVPLDGAGAVNYCYPSLGLCAREHDFTTAEHKHATYVEGLADFMRLIALYRPSSTTAHVCNSETACPAAEHDAEKSPASCPANSDRWSLNVTRFLWDMYDSHDDAGYGEAVSYSWDVVFTAAIRSFPAGFGNHEINEPLGAEPSLHLDDPDGRSIEDHGYFLSILTGGDDIRTSGAQNCLWPADGPCESAENNCSEVGTCIDRIDEYECECRAGFEGDGVACEDIDECADGSAECDLNAGCMNTSGSYECSCELGYEGDGKTCHDVDECATGVHGCPSYSVCENTDGGFNCTPRWSIPWSPFGGIRWR